MVLLITHTSNQHPGPVLDHPKLGAGMAVSIPQVQFNLPVAARLYNENDQVIDNEGLFQRADKRPRMVQDSEGQGVAFNEDDYNSYFGDI